MTALLKGDGLLDASTFHRGTQSNSPFLLKPKPHLPSLRTAPGSTTCKQA